MNHAEARALIARNPRNRDVLFPYLGGDDVTTRPDQSPSRWVINFGDRGLEEARTYPECLDIVERLVKPYRDSVKRAHTREKWWLHEHTRDELYTTVAKLDRVLVVAQTSKYLSITFAPTDVVYSLMTIVLAMNDYASFSILNASWHTDWIVEYCSSLETRLRYLPSDGFETFPFPPRVAGLDSIGERYYIYRQSIMLARQEGITKTYNRFHDPNEKADDIIWVCFI